MKNITYEPAQIEQISMSIVEEYMKDSKYDELEKQVVKRVIHATGDPAYAGLMIFSRGAVKHAVNFLTNGKKIITDVEMVRVGIDRRKLEQLGGEAKCFIHDPEVIRLAAGQKITRAAMAVKWAKDIINGNIMVIGNAPTSLFTLLDLASGGELCPAFVVGVPVGFVGSREAKELLARQAAFPFITLQGVKGGSPVAVSVINALLGLAVKKNI